MNYKLGNVSSTQSNMNYELGIINYLIILFVFCFLFSSKSNAQEIFDLKHCIEIGLENNFEIRIMKNAQQISDNNTTLGNAGYLPDVNLNAGYTGSLDNNVKQITRPNKEINNYKNVVNQNLSAGVNLNWTVFDGFNIQTNYHKLKELQQIGELNTRLSIENFIANIAIEYYNYIQQNIRLKNLEATVILSKERVRIASERYSIGVASRLDFQQAKVDFNSDSSKLINQYEILYASEISLKQMMVLDNIENDFSIHDTTINYEIFLNKEQLLQQATSLNTLLMIYEKEQNISTLELKSAQSKNYPYLKLNAGYGYNQNMYGITSTLQQQNNLGFNYGITLGFNIFDGYNRSRIKENAKIAIDSKELQKEELQLSIKSVFYNTWMKYQSNLKLSNLEHENLVTARDNYEIAMDRYKLGELSGIELREAQNSLLEAEQRLIQARFNTKFCEISLMQICGALDMYIQ